MNRLKETLMKSPFVARFILLTAIMTIAPAVFAQGEVSREKTRDRLSALLIRLGPELKIDFHPNTKNPFDYLGWLKEGLTNSTSFEIHLNVTTQQTIGVRVYPHYNNAYINIDKARNGAQLLRKLVQLNSSTFLFWGADDTGDVFTGYTFTLESGFPDEAIKIVLESIRNSDKYVGEMRPSIDGSNAP